MPFILIRILHISRIDFPFFNSSDILKALQIINWLSGFFHTLQVLSITKETRTRDITSSAKYVMHYLNDIMLTINTVDKFYYHTGHLGLGLNFYGYSGLTLVGILI